MRYNPGRMRNPVFDSAAQPAPDAHNEAGAGLRGRPVSPPRRGRPRSKAADGIGAEIRRRRDLLGLTLREAAAATHVSPTITCEVERGTRMPSVRTYQKLRDGLGLTEPAATLVKRRAPDIPAGNHYRATLAACVVTAGAVALADLAAAMGVSVPAVREGLCVLDDPLAQVGLRLADDGVTVSVAPLAFAHTAVDAVSHIAATPKLTERQLTILCFVAFAGATTLRRIEKMCDSDCESLLARMAGHGFRAPDIAVCLPIVTSTLTCEFAVISCRRPLLVSPRI